MWCARIWSFPEILSKKTIITIVLINSLYLFNSSHLIIYLFIESKTRIFVEIVKSLHWFAGNQIRCMAVSIIIINFDRNSEIMFRLLVEILQLHMHLVNSIRYGLQQMQKLF